MSLPFINDDCWKIELNKIPKYPDFQGQFKQPLDYHLLNPMTFEHLLQHQIKEHSTSSSILLGRLQKMK